MPGCAPAWASAAHTLRQRKQQERWWPVASVNGTIVARSVGLLHALRSSLPLGVITTQGPLATTLGTAAFTGRGAASASGFKGPQYVWLRGRLKRTRQDLEEPEGR